MSKNEAPATVPVELPKIWGLVEGSDCDQQGLNCCHLPSEPPLSRRCTSCGIELKD